MASLKHSAAQERDDILSWTFGLSKLVGVSAMHANFYHKLFGSVIQVLLISGAIFWMIVSRTWESGNLIGFVFGCELTLTTVTGIVCMVYTWKNHNRVKQSIELLENLTHSKSNWYDVNLCLYGGATFLVQVGIDSLLDKTGNLLAQLENVVYYTPLLFNICVTNQFVGLVKQSEIRLAHLASKLKFKDFHPNSIIVEYNIVREACTLINDAYSVQNAWCIFRHSVVFTSYTYYIGLAGANRFPPQSNTRILILSPISAVCIFTYVTMTFKCCDDIQRKYELFKNRFYDRLSTDSRYSTLFSGRPIYKSIKFSAAGVFDLDLKTLNSLIRSLISYILIMLQFAMNTTNI